MEKTNPVGRPEVYGKTDKWEDWIEEWKQITIDVYNEGKLKVKLPTISSLSLFLNDKIKNDKSIDVDCLSNVTMEMYGRGDNPKPEFFNALVWIKNEQKERLLNSGLSGAYNSTIARLVLSTNHGFHEKSENDQNVKIVKMGDITLNGEKLEFETDS